RRRQPLGDRRRRGHPRGGRAHADLASLVEISAGRGTEHGGVLLDVSHLGRDTVLSRLPPACTGSSSTWPCSTLPVRRWRSRRPRTTPWAASVSSPRRT